MRSLSNVSTKLCRIAELARVNRDRCLTSLSHHIDMDLLREAYRQTRKSGATGVDGQTASEYARELDKNLEDLLGRFKSGRYHAPPVKRVYIEKAGGKKRPLGIPTFEDKVLQRAVKMVLEAVYEQDFLDCSYGFRPGRSAHDALRAIREGVMEIKGGWVLDVDISAFFDTLNHGQLREILDQRVRDGVVRRQIDKWLKAGIFEDNEVRRPTEGTPQGGVISPLLANVYLHEALDMWFERDVKPRMRGTAFLVRYADDFVMVFKHESDARRVLEVLPKRLDRFSLKIHPDKTKMVRFERPMYRSQGKGHDSKGVRPGTFDLLGFTHYWRRSLRGSWVVYRKTTAKSLRRAVRAIWEWCREFRHLPLWQQHRQLSAKLRGHYQFYGIRGNSHAIGRFHRRVERVWKRWLGRRSQRGYVRWDHFEAILQRYPLPAPRLRANP